MTVNRQWVQQVGEVLAEIKPREKPEATQEQQALRAFQVYDFNAGPVIVAEQTPKARAAREINRIAAWYGWSAEVTRALDADGASTLQCLAIESLEALRNRMRLLEECVQTGGDAPDAPPAR